MMTGRDLIIYILENGLVDEPICYKSAFGDKWHITGFASPERLAEKYNVGTETVKTWVDLGILDGVYLMDTLYIPVHAKPRFPDV